MTEATYKPASRFIREHGPIFAILFGGILSGWGAWATPVVLSDERGSRYPIHVATESDESVRASAELLANYLQRISGAPFSVESGIGARGIVVATRASLPDGSVEIGPWKDEIAERERYWIRSHEDGLWVIGATPRAVRHAVWAVLHELGYRQFFPGDTWEIVPQQSTLRLDVAIDTKPDYLNRRIWYGYGIWTENKEAYEAWCERNRMGGSVSLDTGHAYGRIIRACQESFDAHPEFFALVDGERKVKAHGKFCISNEALRQRVVDYALGIFAKDSERESISMDPSDGGGWCECEPCVAMGSVSDRAVLLANTVAEAIQVPGRTRLVGMYAYNYHSPPPSIRVHPQVVVSVATAFLRGGYRLDEIVAGWSEKGATLGIREYYSVFPWDHDLPGAARGANRDYLGRTIAEFHVKGARFLSAESSENWGTNGLGYYLASRFLWDGRAIASTEALVDDFFDKAFPGVQEPLREVYAALDGRNDFLLLSDQLARLYDGLSRALAASPDERVTRRLQDLVLYARYVDLFKAYREGEGEARQTAFEALIRHAYRMRGRMMIHSRGLYRDQVGRDKAVEIPDEARWQVPEGENPWKDSTPFSDAEIEQLLTDGLARFPKVTLPFTPVAFSENLRPVRPTLEPTVVPGNLGKGRGTQRFYTWADEDDTTLPLTLSAGHIYGDRGAVRIEVWQLGGASATGERETLVGEDRSVVPNKQLHDVILTLPTAGPYRIVVSDGGDLTHVRWPDGQPMVVHSSVDAAHVPHAGWNAWFYVPEGTKTLGFFSNGRGKVMGPNGKVRMIMEDEPSGYFHLALTAEETGAFWQIRSGAGAIRLMTVPPWFGNRPETMLLPVEVATVMEIAE